MQLFCHRPKQRRGIFSRRRPCREQGEQRLWQLLFMRSVFGLVTSARAAMGMDWPRILLWRSIRRFEKIRRAVTREKSRRAKTAALPELPCGYYSGEVDY